MLKINNLQGMQYSKIENKKCLKQDCLIDLHVFSDHTILLDKPTDSSGEEGLIFLTAA